MGILLYFSSRNVSCRSSSKERKFRPVTVSARIRFLGAIQGKRASRVCRGAWNQLACQLPSDLAAIFILILHKTMSVFLWTIRFMTAKQKQCCSPGYEIRLE